MWVYRIDWFQAQIKFEEQDLTRDIIKIEQPQGFYIFIQYLFSNFNSDQLYAQLYYYLCTVMYD